jgi:hypothetical protein
MNGLTLNEGLPLLDRGEGVTAIFRAEAATEIEMSAAAGAPGSDWPNHQYESAQYPLPAFTQFCWMR